MTATPQRLWWQTGVIYQIYPRSFKDTNGDGVGDLAGIIERLDYLSQTLGVDAIWLSPFYPSPMADFGYDVADYTDVDPLFGDLATSTPGGGGAPRAGCSVIIDFVPNHTSDQHPWFVESRSSRDNPKRDWYIWRDAKPDGAPPNNWLSVFRRPGLGVGRGDRPVLPALVPQGAARPQLAQPGGAKRPCSTCCASGWSAAWTASASTWLTTS